MLVSIGNSLVNLDHVREVEPLPRPQGTTPAVRFTFSDGSTENYACGMDWLDRFIGQIVPAPAGYTMVSALLPDKGEQADVSTFITPILAFRVVGGSDAPVPVTVEGEPLDSTPYAVIRPDGKVSAEGDTFDSVEGWVKMLGR